MPAHDWQVAQYGGRAIESGFVTDDRSSIAGCFAAIDRIRDSAEADAPLDAARKAARAEREARKAEAAERDMRPRAPEILDRKRAQEIASARPGTMAHAIGQAMAKAKARDRK